MQRVWSRPKDQLYVVATLVCLGISLVAAPIAIATKHPSVLIGAVQVFGLVLGVTLVVSTFVPDVWKLLLAGLGERRSLVLTGLAAIAALLCLLVLAAYLAVTKLPWWMILAIVGAAMVKTELQLRYGSVVRRLVQFLPGP